ncbi:MAG: dTMP kinase [Candidatus Sericytochromatia bacterium]
MALIPRSICLAGADGAGKTTQAERLVSRLAAQGVGARVCTVWDMFDRARPGAIPFESKRDIDRFLGGLHPDARAMFLHMAMREALDRALDDRGDRVLVIVGYWLKYNATERAYGASSTLLDHLGEAFPAPELKLYLSLDPEASLARKAVVSGYESGLVGRDGFVAFQTRVHAETSRLLERTGPWHLIDSAAPIDAVASAIARQVDAWLEPGVSA